MDSNRPNSRLPALSAGSTVRRCAGRVAIALAFLLIMEGVRAADAGVYGAFKGQVYEQDNPLVPGLVEETGNPAEKAIQVNLFVEGTTTNSINSVTVQLPNGTNVSLTVNSPGEDWNFNKSFEVKPRLDGEFPDGNYTFSINGANDGVTNIVLALTGGSYPNIPRISNWNDAQNVNPTNAFTLMWDPFVGGTAGDLIRVEIEEVTTNGNNRVFESALPGQPGALTGMSNSVTIAGGTLAESKVYRLTIEFYRIVALNTTYGQGVAAYFKSTRSSLRTTLGADTIAPSLAQSRPSSGTGNVKDNSIISFEFTESMDTNVNAANAITWTGLNPANFSYTWRADGKVLYCNHTPGLPLSTNITWTLNPNGAAALLRDVRGNPLAFTASGEFSTASASNLGQPDVLRATMFKARVFQQAGTTPTSIEQYVFAVDTELNGLNTAGSVSISGPGGTVVAEPGSHGDFIEAEVNYTFQSDLDYFATNGNYTITFNTFHQGAKTVNLALSPEDYPNTPTIQNFSSLSNVNPDADLVLNWDAMTSPGANDFVMVEFDNAFGRGIYESPGPGQVGVLAGNATSVTIPAGTLPPGRTIEGQLIFGKVTAQDTSSYAGVFSGAAFVSVTAFELTTTGTRISPRLETIGVSNGLFQLRVIGEYKAPYTIESIDNLNTPLNWMPISGTGADNRLTNGLGSSEFTDPNSQGVNRRYYRVFEILQN